MIKFTYIFAKRGCFRRILSTKVDKTPRNDDFLKAEKNRKTVINTKSRQLGRGPFGGLSSKIRVIKFTYIFAKRGCFRRILSTKVDKTPRNDDFLKAEKNRKTVINTKSRQLGRGPFGGLSSKIRVIKFTYIFAKRGCFRRILSTKVDKTPRNDDFLKAEKNRKTVINTKSRQLGRGPFGGLSSKIRVIKFTYIFAKRGCFRRILTKVDKTPRNDDFLKAEKNRKTVINTKSRQLGRGPFGGLSSKIRVIKFTYIFAKRGCFRRILSTKVDKTPQNDDFLKAEKNRKTVINTKSRQLGRGLFGGLSSKIRVIKFTYIFAKRGCFRRILSTNVGLHYTMQTTS